MDAMYKGQRYWLTGAQPKTYTTKEGELGRLHRWRTKCLDCGQPFSFWNKGETFPEYPSRRCKVHKVKGRARHTAEQRIAAKRAANAKWIQHNHKGRRYWRHGKAGKIAQSGRTLFEWRTRCECQSNVFSFFNPGEKKLEPLSIFS